VDSPRLEELRRRVARDPASIAFAQLAEEYRRTGNGEEAILVARAGLARHPDYVSARVTLGRALLDCGRPDEARTELERATRQAPDNLAASRALLELNQDMGRLKAAPTSAGQQAAASSDGATTGPQPPIIDRVTVFDRSEPASAVPVLGEIKAWDPAPDHAETAALVDIVREIDLPLPPAETPPEDPLAQLDAWMVEVSGAVAQEPSPIAELPPVRPQEADSLATLDAWLDAIASQRASRGRRRD
jgi:tetratricopeptide (TPR) repeat protein